MVWPAARPVEGVSLFARWTSEGAAPKDRPPLFPEAGPKVSELRISLHAYNDDDDDDDVDRLVEALRDL